MAHETEFITFIALFRSILPRVRIMKLNVEILILYPGI